VDILKEIWCFLKDIHPSFWGVLIGSFFSLGGVIVTNKSNLNRLREQFIHDRTVRKEDRDISFRKEIYMETYESLTSITIAIGKFTDFSISAESINNQFRIDSQNLSKSIVIAKESTLKALSDVNMEILTCFLSMTFKRLSLSLIKDELGIIDSQISNNDSKKGEIVKLMEQHNLDGVYDDAIWSRLNSIFESLNESGNKFQNNRNTVNKKFLIGLLELTVNSVESSKSVGELMVPAVIEIRKELGIPTDEVVFGTILQEQREIAIEAGRDFIKKLELTISEMTEESGQ